MAVTAPKLVVPGNPADWLSAAREWLAVKTLVWVRPEVYDWRPLRAGDTVTLKASHGWCGGTGEGAILDLDDIGRNCGGCGGTGQVTFAEATAAEVLPIDTDPERNDAYVMWDDEADPPAAIYYPAGWWQTGTGEHPIDLPDATPGHWAIRLTNVKETT